jgi:hypothetical protein
MLIVRNCFIAKPGHASQLAAQLKAAAATANMPKHRILTDFTGEFNQVVLEFELDNLAQFEETLKHYQSNTAFREKMKGYTDHWMTGTRELLQTA